VVLVFRQIADCSLLIGEEFFSFRQRVLKLSQVRQIASKHQINCRIRDAKLDTLTSRKFHNYQKGEGLRHKIK